jgi:hypothetical protein
MNSAFQAVTFSLVGLVTLGFFGIEVILQRYASTLPKIVSQFDAAIVKVTSGCMIFRKNQSIQE